MFARDFVWILEQWINYQKLRFLTITSDSAKYFSKVILESEFWQVELHDDDKEKTAFICWESYFILILCRSGWLT